MRFCRSCQRVCEQSMCPHCGGRHLFQVDRLLEDGICERHRILAVSLPTTQALLNGPCQIVNRHDRPPDSWLGEVVTIVSKGVGGFSWGKMLMGVGKWADVDYDSQLRAGKMRLVGYWDASYEGWEQDEYGTKRHVHGKGYHVGYDVDQSDEAPDEPPSEMEFDPWWRGPVGWKLTGDMHDSRSN